MDKDIEKIVTDFVKEFRNDNPQVPERVVMAAVAVTARRDPEYELMVFHRVRGTGIEIVYRKPDGNYVGCVIFNHLSSFFHYHYQSKDSFWPAYEGDKKYADNSMRVTPEIVDSLVNDINNG